MVLDTDKVYTQQIGVRNGSNLLSRWVEYLITVQTIKISILLFYLRLAITASVPWFKRAVRGTIVLLCLFLTTCVLGCFLQCVPLSDFWNFFKTASQKRCLDTTAFFYYTSVFGIVVDIWLLLLPYKLLLDVQRPLPQRLALLGVFMIGIVTTVCSCFVNWTQTIQIFTHSNDPVWDSIPIKIWSVVEVNMGMICASAPSLKAFISKRKRKNSDASCSTCGSISPHNGLAQGNTCIQCVRRASMTGSEAARRGSHGSHASQGSYGSSGGHKKDYRDDTTPKKIGKWHRMWDWNQSGGLTGNEGSKERRDRRKWLRLGSIASTFGRRNSKVVDDLEAQRRNLGDVRFNLSAVPTIGQAPSRPRRLSLPLTDISTQTADTSTLRPDPSEPAIPPHHIEASTFSCPNFSLALSNSEAQHTISRPPTPKRRSSVPGLRLPSPVSQRSGRFDRITASLLDLPRRSSSLIRAKNSMLRKKPKDFGPSHLDRVWTPGAPVARIETRCTRGSVAFSSTSENDDGSYEMDSVAEGPSGERIEEIPRVGKSRDAIFCKRDFKVESETGGWENVEL
ncbi:hypothetical protein BJ508DRAFT_375334 [Ascobolus immersus RN42]|uniref:Rhodopsin domain-containing protein n=1 Tax=Ascobolus immersus RN42 TaxID=1160509 RepID=A0A3N4ICC8_ASCIM|nr:hypothetical protein BJ508DRAFT_375334 [Ascobolus immersus RN42]